MREKYQEKLLSKKKSHYEDFLKERGQGDGVWRTSEEDGDLSVEGVETREVEKFNLLACDKSKDSARHQQIKWKLELRPALKRILEMDWVSVVQRGKRHRLPASPNIIQLLDKFVKDDSLRRLSALEKLQSK